ncbi:biopolymer transporter ExbD [Pelagicoccus sp. NFK12]|uniref:Biopolymer transporter ExbD n=1 Tax=Pelagicoccus enzymogenes TaxID=2773457 RepID=A0A927IH06_9BACT|nr:biopolymer transporter ExbD [Pelagicoccus enzymogenes]MBD5779354.1 biopolymer transporter ExbD [Pelagicoccus enzymogenes]MDQ8198294.1 biopolymer transporter ExbD [Pelagicoccus enzymogenes]
MRNRKNLNSDEESTDINISPLIDMVFILLIFFIVTTVFVEESGLSANTPDPTSNPNQDDDKELVSFLVRANGEVIYKDQDVGIGAVRGIVAPAMRQDEHPITVNVEPNARMSLVVAVIDEAESGGAPQVTMKAVSE